MASVHILCPIANITGISAKMLFLNLVDFKFGDFFHESKGDVTTTM